jgi:hypothetical protein
LAGQIINQFGELGRTPGAQCQVQAPGERLVLQAAFDRSVPERFGARVRVCAGETRSGAGLGQRPPWTNHTLGCCSDSLLAAARPGAASSSRRLIGTTLAPGKCFRPGLARIGTALVVPGQGYQIAPEWPQNAQLPSKAWWQPFNLAFILGGSLCGLWAGAAVGRCGGIGRVTVCPAVVDLSPVIECCPDAI